MDAREKERLRQATMAKRQAIIADLERERGTRVITLIHRKEPWEDENHEAITIEDSEFVLMRIRTTPPEQPIDLILHTPGGLALAAEMIAMALKRHLAKVTVMVPFYAMSGGTLIALAADELRMEPYSVLGPVDPQIAGMPAVSLLRLLQLKPMEMIQDQSLVLLDVARLALENVQRFVRWLLEGRVPPEQAAGIAEFLTGGYLAHDTPITMEVIREMGLNVVEGILARVYDLFETCAFGVCKRPCLARYDRELAL
jgi:ClpP class serine protease